MEGKSPSKKLRFSCQSLLRKSSIRRTFFKGGGQLLLVPKLVCVVQNEWWGSPSIYPNALRRAFYRWNFLSASGSVDAFLEELMRLPFTCFLELPSRIMTVFCGLTLSWQSFGNCGWRGIKGSSKRRWSARMSCKILSSSLHPSGVLSNFFCNYDLVHILAIWESFFVVLWPIRISHLSFCISFLLSI